MKLAGNPTGIPVTFEDFIRENWYQGKKSSSENQTMEIELTQLEVPEQRDSDIEDEPAHRDQTRKGPGRPWIIRSRTRRTPRRPYQPLQGEPQTANDT